MQSLWIIPIGSFVIGGAFLLAWIVQRVARYRVLATVWLLFAVLETAIEARVLCDEECNIRVDLVALGIPLLVWTIASVADRRSNSAGARGRPTDEGGA